MSIESENSTRLHGAQLAIARAVWVMLVCTILVAYADVTVGKMTALVRICNDPSCTMTLAEAAAWRAAGLSPESGNLLSELVFSVGSTLGFVAIAGLIVWRRSDDWMGLLVSFSLIAWGAYVISGVNLIVSTRPGWNFVALLLLGSATLAFTWLFYLFPNGRLVPRGALYPLLLFTAVWLVGILLDTGAIFRGTFQGGAAATPVANTELGLTLFMLVGGIAAQVWRYRRVSNQAQRQQTKWVVLGLCGPILTLVLWIVFVSQFETLPTTAGAIFLILLPLPALAGLVLPASLGIAILHYRLWDIDVIIRRTLVYSVLTAILALFYFGSVVVLQQVFRGLTGQGSDLAIIISTLGIAALFVPLRNRVQRTIDHRFYRRKYDAAQVLAQFATTVRDEVDLERLTGELQSVVEETMQPKQVSVWLKPSQGGRTRI